MHNPEERLMIYEEAYVILRKSSGCEGFCYLITQAKYNLKGKVNPNYIGIDLFPELMAYKPERSDKYPYPYKGFLHARTVAGEEGYWFQFNRRGKLYRLYILKRIIHQMKKQWK